MIAMSIGHGLDCIRASRMSVAHAFHDEFSLRAGGAVANVPELEAAIVRGLEHARHGRPYLINATVKPGYLNPPRSRGKG